MTHKRLLTILSFSILFTLASVPGSAIAQIEATIGASQDNTLYESATGDFSNGAGKQLFAGTTNNSELRRALIKFDVAFNVPAGATVDSVRLTLHVAKSEVGLSMTMIHRVLSDWGEGTSNASGGEGDQGGEGGGAPTELGDATWIHSFFNSTMWNTAGGDFEAAASVFKAIGGPGTFSWGSTPQMVSDVQRWLDSPAENFGWIVRGDESSTQTAKAFDSREGATAEFAPKLQIYYSLVTDVETESVPGLAQLHGNYPNPFSESTKIIFELDVPHFVTLRITDILGREVSVLLSERRNAGVHEVNFDASGLIPGMYLYKLLTGEGNIQTRKMIVSR